MHGTSRSLALPLVALALAAAGCTAPPAAPPPPVPRRAAPPMPQGMLVDPVKEGEHLVMLMGCDDCHTPGVQVGAPDMSHRLAGSDLHWSGPWGVTHAPNLTPDPDTGIGKWSEDDIVRAIRAGSRPDGTVLLPPMPWQSWVSLSDSEAHAVAKFLKTLPPVQHSVPKDMAPGGPPPKEGAFVFLMPPPAWDSTAMTPPAGAKAPPASAKGGH